MWGNPTLFAPGQKYLPKNYLCEKLGQLKWKISIVQSSYLCKNKLFGRSADLKSSYIP